jgi:hypothetical protein
VVPNTDADQVAEPEEAPGKLGAEDTPRWAVLAEDALIILCILPVWPYYILGWTGTFWKVLLGVDILVLVVLLVRRWRRAAAALEKLKEKEDGESQLPFVPPGKMLE